MSELPKLKIKIPHWHGDKEIVGDFKDAEKLFSQLRGKVVVEGEVVHSHKELVKLASQEQYKHKEFLEVTILVAIAGG